MGQKPGEGEKTAKFAQRIDPKHEHLEPEQRASMRRAELAHWQRNVHRLRGRNVATGLGIGAIVLGIYGYTFYSVSQEKFLDELEEDAKIARARFPKTSAN
ncbi:cytochrome c oxidase assembly factor 3 homolog, mitochondrial [Lissotriton helveticus]